MFLSHTFFMRMFEVEHEAEGVIFDSISVWYEALRNTSNET